MEGERERERDEPCMASICLVSQFAMSSLHCFHRPRGSDGEGTKTFLI